MKKIIALFVIMLAFGVNANAQQKAAAPAAATQQAPDKEAIHKAALKDVELMQATIALTDEQKSMFKGLFETKHRTLAIPNLTEERKAVLATNIERKLKSVMDADQIAKLDSNPELLKKLTH